jgi:hypothetical protein
MSLRQVRKLQQSQNVENESQLSSESSDESIQGPRRTSAFAMMRSNSSSSSSSSSSHSEDGNDINAPQSTGAFAAITKNVTPPVPRRTRRPKISQPPPVGRAVVSVLDPTLNLNIRLLNPSNELKRIFGAQRLSRVNLPASAKRGVVIKRRHWLIEPVDASWPMVVKDVFKMEICTDGTHRLVPELDYENKLRILSRIIVTHDIDALYQFVQINPFNPHGLIQLATILISERSDYDTAYQLIRRCLFAIQSAFIPSFHPTKSVILSSDSIFSSCLLRSLLLYAHLLAGQGCSRTSLEVMKLIYAMEAGMSTGCPRTHILIHMDSMAMRAGEYEWLANFVSYNGLTECLPSSAFLFAIAQKQRGFDDQTLTPSARVKKLAVRNVNSESTDATTALIRAVLMFPQLSRAVIGKDLIGVQKKIDAFTNKLIQSFTTKGFLASVKANDELNRWINTVLSNVISECKLNTLNHIQPEWLNEGYANITSAEFEWGKSSTGAFVEPGPIRESEEHVIEVYNEEGFEAHRAGTSSAPVISHPVSLESNPVAAFFQTLLPWSTVDHAGTQSTPITAGGLLGQLRQRLGMDNTEEFQTDNAIIQEVNGYDSHSSESSSDADEIEME